MIEYINNEDKQGDFEQLIGLIDAYNTLMSDRVNDKEQFVDAILFLKNVEVDSEKAKELLTEKIMMSFTPDAEAKYLQKVLNETDVEILRNNIKDDLHKFSLTPDLTDVNFGNNLSGVAIRYKLLGFEQHVKNKERFLVLGLKERFDLYVHYLSLLSRMSVVSSGDVDFVFNRNLQALYNPRPCSFCKVPRALSRALRGFPPAFPQAPFLPLNRTQNQAAQAVFHQIQDRADN